MKEKCELGTHGDKTFEYKFLFTPTRITSHQKVTSNKHGVLIERCWKFYDRETPSLKICHALCVQFVFKKKKNLKMLKSN